MCYDLKKFNTKHKKITIVMLKFSMEEFEKIEKISYIKQHSN